MEPTAGAPSSLVRRFTAGLTRSGIEQTNAWLPGRIIGGTAMIMGSMMWLAAMVLRYLGYRLGTFTAEQSDWFAQQPFAAPGQLAAYAQHPRLVTAGYAIFAGSCIVLAFGVLTLARIIASASPVLAQLAATAVLASLLGRLYFSGVDLTAFRLVDAHGLQHATNFVLDFYVDLSYGLWYIPVAASAGALVGGLLLSLGAFRAGVFGVVRCVLLVAWAWTFLGVLKEADGGSVRGAIALCLVFVPIGVQVLRDRVPALRTTTVPTPMNTLRLHWLW
jgi:hypothetical protein